MRKFTTLFLLLFTAFNMLAASITLYYVDESGWGNIHAYAWKNSTQANLGGWPGNPATLESKTKGGKNVYSYTFESTAADRIIFNNGGNGKQTPDLTVNTSKPYYYSSTWNATITYDAPVTYCMAGTASVSGTNWCCGQEWSPSGCELTDGSISFSALPAGDYKFKITNGTWNQSWGYSALTSVVFGLANDLDGNVVMTLTQTSDVKIDFNSSTKKITVTITEVSTPVDPDQPVTPTATIAAIRSRLSINTNDFTDFAGLYVSKLPTITGGTLSSYEWQFSTDNASWAKYSGGDGATWDNIRPNKAGYYRCVLSYTVNEETQTVTSNTLQITNKGGSTVTFSSNLPVVLVRTSKDFPTPPAGYPTTEQVAELKAKRSVDVKILWNKEGGTVSNTDINNSSVLHYDRKARMNYRGSSSLNNPKKSYAFVAGDKNCDSKKLGEVKTKKFAMFDGDAHKDWVMYASYPDATFMRNILSYHQYAKMTGLWGVKCRYVEMYLDGEYQGIYVFMDKMTQDETRINVNEDTGYIVRFDKTDIVDRFDGTAGKNADSKRCTFITSNTGKKTIPTYNMQVDQAFEIEYPEREDISTFDDDDNIVDDSAWEAKVSEVKGMFVAMENAILANDYDKLAQIIDYESWADWFIINEFTRNADAYRISCVFQINSATDKIVANPIWDYELGLGNQDTKTSGLMVEDNTYYNDDFPTPFWWTGKGKSGCNGILGDCKFKTIVKERWAKHIGTNGALNSIVLNAKIDSLANVLSQGAGAREKSKWSTYSSSSTSTLKSWITNRTSGLNSIINAWTTCSGETTQTTYYIAGALIENGTAVSGGDWCCGLKWDPAGCALTNNTVTYVGLPAGEYKFKITDGSWSKNWGYSALTSNPGLTNDIDGNVVVSLSKASDVTITFNPGLEKITVTIKASSVPVPEVDFTIDAIRSRLSINTNDFTDFAGLYVAKLPTVEGGTLSSYAWQYSTDNSIWTDYSAGEGATWDNIRPNKAGYYRCVITYDVSGVPVEQISNVLQIKSNGGSAVTFSSKLPVFLVRTSKDFPVHTGSGYPDNDGVAALKAKRSVDVKILWNQEGGSVTNADVNNSSVLYYDRKARMNYRGSSSLYNDKKSYAFVTGDKNCDSKKLGEVKTKKLAMFGDDAHKDWVLYASYPDATYMRNVLSYHQYAQMTGLWGVKCRYVELYVDGSYQGIYVFMDKITADENRVNINEDTGYIVKFDKTDIVDRYNGYSGANEDYKRCTFTTSNTGRTNISTYNQVVDQAFEIDYPEREDLAEFDDDGNVTDDSAWEAKVSGVKARFEEMETAILNNNYEKLATIIDYETWADWFIINEFTKNADAYRISCVFTLNSLEDKIVANPIWDYELGWGNQNTITTGLMVEESRYYSDSFPTPFWWTGKGKSGCNGILGDCKFRAIVKERWAKYIAENGALNSVVLNAKIDSLASNLATSSTRTSVSTSSLKSWVSNRTTGLDNVIKAWETCPVPPFVVNSTITNIKCNGEKSGSISLEVSGSVAPYTYTWTYPDGTTANTKDISGLRAGIYDLRIEDSIGLTYESTYEVTEPEALVLTSFIFDDVNCNGAADGIIYEISAEGGTSSYKFDIYYGETLVDMVNLSGGDHRLIITDANGCTLEKDFYIYEPEKLELVVNAAVDPSEFGASDGLIDISVTGGKGSYKYHWSNLYGFEADTEDVSGLPGAVYTVYVTDENDCVVINEIELFDPKPKPFEVNSNVTDIKCNGENSGSISLEVSGSVAPYTYTWTYPDGTTANTKDISGLRAGIYDLLIFDSIGLTYHDIFEVSEPEALGITVLLKKDVTCNGAADGAIDVAVIGGTGNYIIEWEKDGSSISSNMFMLDNLSSGLYKLTVTDRNGCSYSVEEKINEPDKVVANIVGSTVVPYCEANGELTAELTGGVAPYTYKWTDGFDYVYGTGQTISNLGEGVYYLYAYDANGCLGYSKANISSTESLTITETIKDVTCYGMADGVIDIEVTGGTAPYTYSWIGGDVESTAEDQLSLMDGTYTVNISDVNGCKLERQYTISGTEALAVESTIKNISCYAMADGAIDIEVYGGTAPYKYYWTAEEDGSTFNSEDLDNLKGGIYTFDVIDANGCAFMRQYLISEPEKLEAYISGTRSLPYCDKKGELTAMLLGGTAPYTYEWTAGVDNNVISTDKTVSIVNEDVYYLHAYDANGCLGHSKLLVQATRPIEIEVTSLVHVGVYGESTGVIEIDATGGQDPYNYLWEGPGIVNPMNQNQYQLPAGYYTVMVEDAEGCKETEIIEVRQPDITTGAQEIDANVTITANNGLISVSEGKFIIYNVIGQDVTIYNGGLLPGTYMVEVSDKLFKVIMR